MFDVNPYMFVARSYNFDVEPYMFDVRPHMFVAGAGNRVVLPVIGLAGFVEFDV